MTSPELGLLFSIQLWYNYTQIEFAWRDLLSVASSIEQPSSLLLHDLVDVTRQFLQNRIDQFYADLVPALKAKQLENFRKLAKQFVEAMHDMERILSTHSSFLLGNWLESANRMATNAAEAQLFEINARNQITLWGPTGQIVDYAMKQWSGVVADYCLPRWQLFFDTCLDALTNGTPLNMDRFREKVFKSVENPFNVNDKRYPTEALEDSVEVAKVLYAKWLDE